MRSQRQSPTGSRWHGMHASNAHILTSSTSRCWSCSLICVRTDLRLTSCPAAASNLLRVWSDRIYGVPPEQVIGSSIVTKFDMKDGKPVLVREAKIDFIDDKAGKPVAINKFIGRPPIFAFGNSDGDLQMLQ